MIRRSNALFVFLCLLFVVAPSVELAQSPEYPLQIPGEVIVKFKKGLKEARKAEIRSAATGQVKKRFQTLSDLELVKLPAGMSVEEGVRLFGQSPDVVFAEPNYVVHLTSTPNDPLFGDLWGLHNLGAGGGTPDSDIDAPEAWDITTGSSGIVVAVIDSGVDYSHEDLAANMFQNSADCNSDGFDDDGNGFVDDCYGIDTMNDDSDPMDDNGHGTHVAGTIGARGNNGIGVVGVNQVIEIMACKFVDSTGSGSIADAIDCLDYVRVMKDRGVNVVATNNSWGGPDFSQALDDAIAEHLQDDILFVSAAGNGNMLGIGQDNDWAPFYPCNTYLPHVLCVSAVDSNDNRAGFSNYGKRTVDLDAPGVGILSTTPGNGYQYSDGTSMATPHVTGTAALLKAGNSSLDWKALKNLILAGGDSVPGLDSTVTAKRLNAYGAFACSDSTILSRLRPTRDTAYVPEGEPVHLAVLHINCAVPNGEVTVSVDETAETLTLLDDGIGPDQLAGDGIYSAEWVRPSTENFTIRFPGDDVVTVVTGQPGAILVSPTQLAFGGAAVGETVTLDVNVTNVGGDTVLGFASTNPPFSVGFLGLYVLPPGQSQPMPVSFTPTSTTDYTGTVSFSGGEGATVGVSGFGTAIQSITPNSIDLASPPSGFTVQGNGFEDFGFGLPVANFYNGSTIVAQARATSGNATVLTIPYPTEETSVGGPHPGLVEGLLVVKVFNQLGPNSWRLLGSTNLAVEDTTPAPDVEAISPNVFDLAAPPSSFTVTGFGFADFGFGLPVANFYSGNAVVAQARGTASGGSALTLPFPSDATSIGGPRPGLSAGTFRIDIFNQTGAAGWQLVGSTTISVDDSRPPITPNPITLASPPASFVITGNGFVDVGLGLPVVNFYSGGTVAAQARAVADNDISIEVPFPTDETSIGGPKPGLSSGTFTVRVFNQTGPNGWVQIAATSLTVVDATISPNPIDLASKPSHFTVTGNGFADLGFGLPVANFYSGNSIVAQARATAGDATSLTLPFPTDETSIGGPRPGLTDGIFQVKIFNQTGSSSWLLVGSTELTVENSTGNDPSVDSIAPTSIDLASPPTEFTILGNGFDDFGFGLPVINFYSGSIVVAQARAADGDGNSLTVPFPNDATSLSGNHPGLAAGSYIVRVFNQTGPNAWFEVGTTGLTVSDSRPPIAPNPIDLAAPPPEFEITGTGFRDHGFGLPVTNFYSGGTVMAQARAIADNDISITVPFPTDHTSIGGPKPGLSAGVFIVRVFNQTGPNNWDLIVTTSLTVTDSSP